MNIEGSARRQSFTKNCSSKNTKIDFIIIFKLALIHQPKKHHFINEVALLGTYHLLNLYFEIKDKLMLQSQYILITSYLYILQNTIEV